jgi:hypothetical protein
MSEARIAADAVIELERQYRFQWEAAQQSHCCSIPKA